MIHPHIPKATYNITNSTSPKGRIEHISTILQGKKLYRILSSGTFPGTQIVPPLATSIPRLQRSCASNVFPVRNGVPRKTLQKVVRFYCITHLKTTMTLGNLYCSIRNTPSNNGGRFQYRQTGKQTPFSCTHSLIHSVTSCHVVSLQFISVPYWFSAMEKWNNILSMKC